MSRSCRPSALPPYFTLKVNAFGIATGDIIMRQS